MIYFVIGSSSVGKSRLLDWLSHNIPSSKSLVGDKVASQVTARLQARLEAIKPGEQWPYRDEEHYREVYEREVMQELVRQVNATKAADTLFVDDIVENVVKYLKQVTKPYKVILVGTTLTQLKTNILSRVKHDPRSAASVLKETMKYYDPLAACSVAGQGLEFTKAELDSFLELKRMKLPKEITEGLDAAVQAFRIKYFRRTVDRCYVCPSKFVPRVDYRVLHDDTERAGSVIKRFVVNKRRSHKPREARCVAEPLPHVRERARELVGLIG
jgi:hypothetical protein